MKEEEVNSSHSRYHQGDGEGHACVSVCALSLANNSPSGKHSRSRLVDFAIHQPTRRLDFPAASCYSDQSAAVSSEGTTNVSLRGLDSPGMTAHLQECFPAKNPCAQREAEAPLQ